MAWVETRITRTTQPQDACGIDWSNPLTKGLVFATVNDRDLVTQTPAQRMPLGSAGAGPKGVTHKSTSVATGGSFWALPASSPLYGIQNNHSVIVFGAAHEIASFGNFIGVPYRAGAWASPYYSWVFSAQADASVASYSVSPNASAREGATTGSGFFSTDGVYASFGASWRGGNLTFFKNGVVFGGIVSGSAAAVPDFTNRQPLCMFNRSNTAQGEGVRGEAACAYIFNRALSAPEFKSLSDNPWQIFEPEVQRIWVDDYVSMGGGATVIPIGVQATGLVGTPTAVGGASIPATALPAGVQALGAVGEPTATVAALAGVVGVNSVGAVGSLSATGAAITVTAGVGAVGAVGAPVAIGETIGVTLAYPEGVQSVSAVGTPNVIAAARVIPIGVQAVGEVGEPLAYAGDTPPVVATSNYGFEMSAGKRYYIKRKGKILLFNSAEQADEYLETEQQATVVKSRGARKRIAAKLVKVAPIETIELEPVTELLSRYMPDVSLPNLLKMRDIEQVLAMQMQALQMQDDEDIELLLMTL